MTSKRKRRLAVAAGIIVVLGILLGPLPVREVDREAVIADATLALRNQRRVLLDWKYIPFYDSNHIAARQRTWYYWNETPLSSANLDELGLLPLPEAIKAKVPGGWYEKNLLIEVTSDPDLRFNVYHGWMGAQGYRVRVYRCLLGSFAYFTCEWVS